MNKAVTLADGTLLKVGLTGNPGGKTVMLPIAKKSVAGRKAENLKLWGIDPELGKTFVEGLSDRFQVLYFDYEGHLFEHPQPDRLTPDNLSKDLLHIADEMDVGQFSYYGYSWLALAGLQLALRTNRMESLIMGGFPPYRGPYKEMMAVTEKTYEQSVQKQTGLGDPPKETFGPEEIDWDNVQVTMNPEQTRQFVTLYTHLMDFDDRIALEGLNLPKLAFAGAGDTIVYGKNFGDVTVDIAGLLRTHEGELRQSGWEVYILEGERMDHIKAMQPDEVLPLIKPWLIDKLGG